MTDNFDYIYSALADIAGLSLFAAVRESPPLAALRDLLEDLSDGKDDDEFFQVSSAMQDIISDWASFTAAFIQCTGARAGQDRRDCSFYLIIARLALADDNPYTHAAEQRQNVPPALAAMARTDLSRLGRLAAFEIHNLGFHVAETLRKNGLEAAAQSIEEESRVFYAEGKKSLAEKSNPLLAVFPENANWSASLPALTEYLRRNGAGVMNQHHSFYWMPPAAEDIASAAIFFPPAVLSLSLRPAHNPDPVRLADLCGYEQQRSVVIANTLRLLEGGYANNLLLYGDRGTGKSATVKAAAAEYAGRGLKLLEAGKEDLPRLAALLDLLAGRPLKFIIFIDDISFETTDDSFRGLKALLEGGIERRPANVVIYATSNRRHLVKERLNDRPTSEAAADAATSGDMRAFDTMQEQFSLADRFGLTVIYASPGQEEYLRIAEHIAERRGLLSPSVLNAANPGIPDEERARFRENALKWEKWFNGRSPRTAAQYVDWAASGGKGGVKFPWE
jgi:predicted AAA+ superfamily ATPase